MVEIKYNGVNPFGTRTPVVAREEQIVSTNGYKSRVDRFTLRGSLKRPSCSAMLSEVHDEIQTLINRFLQNFGTFQVIENGIVIFSSTNAIVKGVNVDRDSFANLIPYTISIDCIVDYAGLGIVEPQNEFTFTKGENSMVTVNHTISCRGVGTNALNNAKAFIAAYRGLDVNPMFCGSVPANYVLTSRNETPNRLTGEYTLSETFYYNPNDSGAQYGVLEYKTEVQDADNTLVTITGDITGDIDRPMSSVRAKFSAINFDAIAQAAYGSASTLSGKGAFSVTEDAVKKKISFTISYSSGLSCTPYIVDKTTISTDILSGIICISTSAQIRADCGSREERWNAVKSYYESLNKKAYADAKWATYGNGEPLNPTPQSSSASQNDYAATIEFSQTYCTGGEDCGCLENLEYSLDFAPAINKYVVRPVLDGNGVYNVQDLGFSRRPRFSVRGTCRPSLCCEYNQFLAELKTKINYLCNFYFVADGKILEKSEISESDGTLPVSFNYTWNAL